LVLATALTFGATSTTDVSVMPYADIAVILRVTCLIGLAALFALALAAQRIAIDPEK
jgi:hypothetical protein